MVPVQRTEVVRGIGARTGGESHTVLPDDHCRHALTKVRELHFLVEDRAIRVRVRVYEPGHHHPPRAVDDPRVVTRQLAADPGDQATFDGDIRPTGRFVRSWRYESAAQDKVFGPQC